MMSDRHHRQARRHGLDRLVELELSGDQGVAAAADDLIDTVPAGSTDDAYLAGRPRPVTGNLHVPHAEGLRSPGRKVADRPRVVGPATAAEADERQFGVGLERRHAREAQPVGELVVDAPRRRIPGGVTAPDARPRMDQVKECSARAGGGREPGHGPERQRMVRDDEIDPLAGGLGDNLRRDRQAGHHPLERLPPGRHQQSNRVPVGRKPQGGEAFQGGGDGCKCRHAERIL